MKITLAMVMSVDGKTTQGNDPNIYTWTSSEDLVHFNSLKNNARVIIMGRKTYDSVKDKIKLTSQTLRLVVTNNPEKYIKLSVPDQFEFTSSKPLEIVNSLESRGYREALLVGGHILNRVFFNSKLVNKLVLTVEPIIFGQGLGLVADSLGSVSLQLESIKKLNERGTLVCRYNVL